MSLACGVVPVQLHVPGGECSLSQPPFPSIWSVVPSYLPLTCFFQRELFSLGFCHCLSSPTPLCSILSALTSTLCYVQAGVRTGCPFVLALVLVPTLSLFPLSVFLAEQEASSLSPVLCDRVPAVISLHKGHYCQSGGDWLQPECKGRRSH